MSIEKQVKDILIERFDVVPDDNKTLVKDLYLDSLDLVELYMELEKTFAISIPDDMAEQISLMTVADLIKYVVNSTGGEIHPVATIMVSQSNQKPEQKPFKSLYTTSADGKAECRLTGRPCQKIEPGEIEKNHQLLNLCRQHKCIIEKNFQEIMQEHTK